LPPEIDTHGLPEHLGIGSQKTEWSLSFDRFDLRPDGIHRGFEDFCVRNARRTDEKYRGSYETSVMKRFQQFANSPAVLADVEKLFTLIVLNCALRNGDAHLKNFGIVYDDVLGEARLAPLYDLVTTSIYLPKDGLALTLNGTTQWPDSKALRRLGETRMTGTPAKIRAILERISDALSQTEIELRSYIKEHPDFKEVGERILQEWIKGPTTLTSSRLTVRISGLGYDARLVSATAFSVSLNRQMMTRDPPHGFSANLRAGAPVSAQNRSDTKSVFPHQNVRTGGVGNASS
jgi:serine/threonine-protein kinase HipA